MSFIVATNVVASQLPERRPTGTPNAHANNTNMSSNNNNNINNKSNISSITDPILTKF